MNNKALIWLLCNAISIIILAFYSMLEMACVSFNKVRLQYYVSKGYKRAIWLNYLLQNPSRLFGTTLIGVNIALVVGSECARQFYAALGLSPDLAPLTQVLLVVIFGELAPMFAARLYAENVAMLGVPLIYASAKLMTPFLWGIGLISKLCNLIVGGNETETNIYLNQEELQKILEEHSDEPFFDSESEEYSAISANIFGLRGKTVKQIMDPLSLSTALPSNATIENMETLLNKTGMNYAPVYNREISSIVGIAYPRDVLRALETRRVRDYTRTPWFVTETTSIMQILRQFRSNNENVAIILNDQGKAIGLVNLSDVLEEIFGEVAFTSQGDAKQQKQLMLIDKTFPADITVGDFNSQYGILLDQDPTLTLADVLIAHLGHHPEKGESILIAPFELSVKETSLLDIKTISISTIK